MFFGVFFFFFLDGILFVCFYCILVGKKNILSSTKNSENFMKGGFDFLYPRSLICDPVIRIAELWILPTFVAFSLHIFSLIFITFLLTFCVRKQTKPNLKANILVQIHFICYWTRIFFPFDFAVRCRFLVVVFFGLSTVVDFWSLMAKWGGWFLWKL